MKKVLYFDCETTGLDPIKNDIIQIAGIIEIDGIIKEEFDYKCQPVNMENIDQKSLDIHKITLEQLKSFQPHQSVYGALISLFDKYINKYNKKDKFIPAGYNVGFDVAFLFSFFEKHGNSYCGAYLDYHKLDPLPILLMLDIKGSLKLDSFKLEQICKTFEISITAHNALSDIQATREIIQKVMTYFK